MIIEEREANELNYDVNKKVKTRKDHQCYNSGFNIRKGSVVECRKVLPSSSLGRLIGLKKPQIFYKCGRCGPCTH